MKSQSAGLLESVLRAKSATLSQDGLKEVVTAFLLFLEPGRSDWHESERRLGTDVAGGASKPCRSVQLPSSAVTDQTQVHVDVGTGIATGVRAEQIDRRERHDFVERYQAFADGVCTVAKAWRKIFEQQLHRANNSSGPARAQASRRDQRVNSSIYPYLLREHLRSSGVWCADITHIRLAHGFVSLVAILDWASRKVLSWELSITADQYFVIHAVEEARSLINQRSALVL
jgi:hypothetical protein